MTKISGGVGSQLLAALRFGGLIDAENKSTPALAELVDAYQTDQWQAALRKFVRQAYAPIVAHDLASLTPAQFHELFKGHYPASDEVVRKCETFFIAAARGADIPVNARITKFRTPRGTGNKRRSGGGADVGGKREAAGERGRSTKLPAEPPAPPQMRGAYDTLIGILDLATMDEEETAAVWTLIRYLKKQEVKE